MNTKSTTLTVFVFTMLLTNTSFADWLAFRGSDSNGVAAGVAPRMCDEDSVAWKVDVPGKGVSSPIVIGDQVVVTASSGVEQERLHVISYDANDGSIRWHRQFWATGRTMCHTTSANAAPTPASDGKHIVAFFSSNDVVCLGIDGDLNWFRGLASDNPKLGNDIGMASSPMIANGVVVCQAESQGDSFVEAMKVKDGTTLWKQERPKDSNWTSPVHIPATDDVGDLVVIKSDQNVSAHNLETGDEVWKIDGEVSGIPCMVVTKSRLYVPGSSFLAVDRKGDKAEVAWESNKIKPSPSPIATEELLIYVNSAGVLNCHSTETGDRLWQLRVGGKYWASPIMDSEGFVYAFNDRGTMTIVSPEGKKLATHEFDGTIMGTPAISDGSIYIRGVEKLWKVVSK